MLAKAVLGEVWPENGALIRGTRKFQDIPVHLHGWRVGREVLHRCGGRGG